VVLASFLVSHVIPFGSAAGSVVNVDTLEKDGVAAATTGEAIALTSLVSTAALIVLFGAGFAATAGRHLPQAYLVTAGVALAGVTAALAAVFGLGAHPAVAGGARG
jgi:protein-S-isoprenylcysteine O-methyltransferase Ste14